MSCPQSWLSSYANGDSVEALENEQKIDITKQYKKIHSS